MAPGADEAPAGVWQGLGGPCPEDDDAEQTVPKGKGCRYWLKIRTFGEQSSTCASCQGPLRLRAFVHDSDSIRRILTYHRRAAARRGAVGLSTHVPRPAPARGTAYYRGPVRRIQPETAQHQRDL